MDIMNASGFYLVASRLVISTSPDSLLIAKKVPTSGSYTSFDKIADFVVT